MTMDGRLQLYRTTDTMGKSQIELLLQVYDGAIRGLQGLGEPGLTSAQADKQIQQSRKCVTHLYTTLDFENGRELAAQLGKLYSYVLSQFDLLSATRDKELIDRLIRILSNLRDGWSTLKTVPLAEQPTSTPSPGRSESLQLSA